MDNSIEDQADHAEKLIEEISQNNRAAQAQLVQALMTLDAKYKDLAEVQAALADENEEMKDENASLRDQIASLRKDLEDALDTNKSITLENADLEKSRNEWRSAFNRVKEGLERLQNAKNAAVQSNVVEMRQVSFMPQSAEIATTKAAGASE